MSNIKELIREKIDAFYADYKAKFHQNADSYYLGIIDGLDMAERILDTLPDEPVTDCHDLEEEAVSYCFDNGLNLSTMVATDFALHFAEWGADHLRDATKKIPEDSEEAAEDHIRKVIDAAGHPGWDWTTQDIADAFKAGTKWMKAKMMDGAVEGEICGRVYDHLNIRFADGVCKYLEPKNISHIPADVSKYNIGDKVKIIIVKED